MKKILLSISLLSGLAFTAQNYTIQISEGSESIGAGNNNSFSVIIYEADIDEVEKEWKSTVKDYNTEKTNLTKHTLFGDNAVIKEMGNGTVDIYTNFIEKKEDKTVRMVVAFDLGGAYLSSGQHKEKADIAKKIIKEFAVKMTKEGVSVQVKVAEKALEKLNDKQKDLEKGKKDMEENIVDDKAKIKKAEEDIKKNEENIKKNETDQLEQKKLIEAQKKVTDDVKKKMEAVK
ncbi:MAG: hypothetical protein IAF38_01370 [Bacteroidia bacterium]|nr:hypothetical protein [Bacteroidia bacterium]